MSDEIMDYIRDLERRAYGPAGLPAPEFQPATAPDPEKSLGLVRKGRAVCLASDLLGEHIWIVADKEDAALLQAEEPGAVSYDLAEVEILLAIEDREIVKEVHAYKRRFKRGRISR